MKFLALTASALILAAACSQSDSDPAAPIEDVDNTTNEADAGDTSTEAVISEDGFRLTPIAEGLEFPWDMLFLPDGTMLVTERSGTIRLVRDVELLPEPVAGTPEAHVSAQGGYFAMALDPDFASNRKLYLAFAKGTAEQNTTAVVSGVLSDNASELSDVQEIFTGAPRETSHHYGGRLAFLPDGTLIAALGEGFRYMEESQNPQNYHGTIVRLNTDGSFPEDNPFIDGENGLPGVWSYGHRNVQGLVWDEARETLWAHEHGPKGGDELNRIEAGNNYGWPAITYGVNYDGTIITDETEAPGMEQPVVKWVPSIAPSGMALVSGDVWSEWDGDLIVGAMNGPRGKKLVHIMLDEEGNVTGQADLMADLEIPFRDVAISPDGNLYAATANMDGVVYRIDRNE
ncbi:PQQ-dependent sugar dehydrogenase [Henriciella marina]|uniref:PQQ-dependent sugar dehydrogenase n=1 Tax=Henriciella marina TaxID=453851 RepID=A0ABT4LVE2_9PROT|nr:PQQ-dependent sugar dehydrogenase [Henriciella marina]MCZ4297513.1 PQQ-dependent sugar dehydrogenase [Henriciella marina]